MQETRVQSLIQDDSEEMKIKLTPNLLVNFLESASLMESSFILFYFIYLFIYFLDFFF